jgi:hypothetical protein
MLTAFNTANDDPEAQGLAFSALCLVVAAVLLSARACRDGLFPD